MATKRQRAPRHRTAPDPLAARIGARVRALRREKAFTFDAFVEETRLGRGYVSELERGLVVPTVAALARVARALEVTIADLVLGDTDREQMFEASRGVAPARLKQIRALLDAARAEYVVPPERPLLVADVARPKRRPS
jgi:transcriptional regulator with XRE-family HTH domain